MKALDSKDGKENINVSVVALKHTKNQKNVLFFSKNKDNLINKLSRYKANSREELLCLF